ncbi:zinc finger Ran-binding domain-containing protein 2-like isoform X4 [Argiope bruennichi]|uniref:zinc finger Ran-binding domain-containing protein 2-like isoform X3 n=1 Tax=Argiope bruennichi TaxID=94029 RepID=UPI002494F2DA|nr:zinc finger Ran-binding domain-containing protein 2-like isoform X3 [Argiope bruennichi]XP_055946257.1 zinc finger Ran-binding domain-containing protein 2-like isoform X4 [Argiope bruennichi]
MSTSRKNLRLKKSFLKQINVNDVMEELKANNYFENAHREMLAFVKDSLPYKQMQEVALQHMLDSLTNVQQLPDEEGRKEKKRHISKIGLFAIELNKLISKTLSDKLSQEATVVAKRALKRLYEKSECSNSKNDGGKKRKQKKDSSKISQNTNEKNQTFPMEDSDSFVSLMDVSDESVSSVHTSDLSSFDDEIVVSSEDEMGEKQVKRISFKTAEKAYFDDDFSKVSKSMVDEKNNTDEVSEESKISKSTVQEKSNTNEASEKSKTGMSLSNTSKNSIASENIPSRPKRERKNSTASENIASRPKRERKNSTATENIASQPKGERKNSTASENIASRPKRERKPNSRYSAEEMYL